MSAADDGYEEDRPAEPAPDEAQDDALALILAKIDGIARDISVIRRQLGAPE